MIRKIILGVLALFVLLIVVAVGFGVYAYKTNPQLAEVTKAVTGKHPPTYSSCLNNAFGHVENVPIEIENDCRAAAEAGDPMAQWIMGDIASRHGKEDATKYAEAMKWYELASAQNNRHATASLGLMYYAGRGVEVDYTKALPLFLTAAKQKDGMAQIMLITMYSKGKGIEPDNVQALKWFAIALENNEIESKQKNFLVRERDKLTAQMTPEQQALAKEMASEF